MVGDSRLIRPEVEKRKWKFSAIDGDPVMGEGVKCYATRLYNRRYGQERVQGELVAIAEQLAMLGFTVLRRKVEWVIFDDKNPNIRCTGDAQSAIWMIFVKLGA